jgi:hypothetical protein
MKHIYSGSMHVPQRTEGPAPHRYKLRVLKSVTACYEEHIETELSVLCEHTKGMTFDDLLVSLSAWAQVGEWSATGCLKSFDPAVDALCTEEGIDGVSYELHLNPCGPDEADPAFDIVRVLYALSETKH